MPDIVGFIGDDPRLKEDSIEAVRARFEYFDRNFAQWLPPSKEARVLDFGCGLGGFLSYLESRGYSDAVGFDIDNRYAEFARSHLRSKVQQASDGLAFLRKNAALYDLTVAIQVAYYFPRLAVQEWFDALAGTVRPGGMLLIEVFNGAGLVGGWPYVNDPFIQVVFSESLLEVLVARAGLKLVSLRDEQVPPGGLQRTLWRVGRRVWHSALQSIYVLERGQDARNPRYFGKNLIAVARRP